MTAAIDLPRSRMLDAALAYARRGWAVFPCARSKTPMERGEGKGVLLATTKEQTITAWWTRWPNALIGIGAGASQLVIVDVDTKKGDGWATLAEVQRELGTLPSTYRVRTPSVRDDGEPAEQPGAHLYYLAPEGVEIRPSAGKVAPYVDVRAGNSYVIAPPSAGYVVIYDAAIAELPAAWIERLRMPERVEHDDTNNPCGGKGYSYGTADQIERRAIAYVEKKPPAISGSGGHLATFEVAAALGRGFALPEHDVFRILRDHYNPRCQPPWRESDLRHKAADGVKADRDLGYLLEADRDRERAEVREMYRDHAPPHTDEDAPSAVLDPDSGSSTTATAPVLADPFADWRTMGDLGPWLDAAPPPRDWLLERDDSGAVAKAIVALLVAPGGRGKTMALIQLAISLATGRPWLDTFQVGRAAGTGRIVLALAEEPPEELRRRLYYAARAMDLDDEERRAAYDRIVPLGLQGRLIGLVDVAKDGVIFPSAVHASLVERLGREEHAAVILDPLSRWAPEAESGNAAATMAVQCLEQLTAGPGNPTVVVAHHTSKWSRREGNKGDSSGARGVTGLTDGVRWVGGLAGVNEKDIALEISKSNYAPKGARVELVRDVEHGGILRPPNSAELDARTVAEATASTELQAAVLAAVRARPGVSKRRIRDGVAEQGVKARAQTVDATVDAMVSGGALDNRGTASRGAYHVPDEGEEQGA